MPWPGGRATAWPTSTPVAASCSTRASCDPAGWDPAGCGRNPALARRGAGRFGADAGPGGPGGGCAGGGGGDRSGGGPGGARPGGGGRGGGVPAARRRGGGARPI